MPDRDPTLPELLTSVKPTSEAKRDFDTIAHAFVDLTLFLQHRRDMKPEQERKAARAMHKRVDRAIATVTRTYNGISEIYNPPPPKEDRH